MRKLALSAALGAALAASMAGGVIAAEPNNQACLGEDFSSYARYGSPGPLLSFDAGAGFGLFNATLAQAVPGLGFPIQFHLAGYIPDWYVANSCNNP